MIWAGHSLRSTLDSSEAGRGRWREVEGVRGSLAVMVPVDRTPSKTMRFLEVSVCHGPNPTGSMSLGDIQNVPTLWVLALFRIFFTSYKHVIT